MHCYFLLRFCVWERVWPTTHDSSFSSGSTPQLLFSSQDKKNLKKINKLLKDISRNPFEGIGKPEPLKENLTGFWSRRIDEEHRLVYAVEDERVIIFACRGHYDD